MSNQSTVTKNVKFSCGGNLTRFNFSPVDILIPFHGQYRKVRDLVESILLYTKTNPYLIYLIDDASPNKDFLDLIRGQAPLKGMRLDQQTGFAGALKAGYEATRNPWVVFMHSDCKVADPHWLQHLGETASTLKDQNVRLVHARTDNPMCENTFLPPTTQQQICGNIIVSEDEPLPLITAMVHRDLFKHIGGFLKEYPYAGYEDVELYWRMKKNGFKQAVCGKSWVHHDGGATIKEMTRQNKTLRNIMESNYDKCLKDIS